VTADTGVFVQKSFLAGDTYYMQSLVRGAPSRAISWLRLTFRFVGRLGFGRQSALVATRRMFPMRAITPARQAISLLVGTIVIGTGVALLTQADLGLSPFDVLVSGLLPRVGLSFGQTVWLVSGVLFTVAAALGHRPNRWGIAYVLSVGIAIDLVSGVIVAPASLAARVAFVVAALALLSAGISLVVHSGTTGGSFELLTAAGEARGLNRQAVRTTLEVGVFAIGVALGGNIGPATLVIALGIGPMLGVMGQAFADHSHGRARRLIQNSPDIHHPSAMAQRVR